jgi:hypothetical protein
MNDDNSYVVFWSTTGNANKTSTDRIIFEVHARTHGWIGMGFSANGAMTGADLVIVWIDKYGHAMISVSVKQVDRQTIVEYLKDRHGPSDGNGYPPIDQLQNYNLISARSNQTHTIVRFQRQLSTCDPNDWTITVICHCKLSQSNTIIIF